MNYCPIHGYFYSSNGMCPNCQGGMWTPFYYNPAPIYNVQCPHTTDISGAILKTIEGLRRRELLKKEMTALELTNLGTNIAKDISDGTL